MAQDFYVATGRRVSTVTAVAEYFEALKKLDGRSLNEAVEGFLRTVSTVKRKDIKVAVEEFIRLPSLEQRPQMANDPNFPQSMPTSVENDSRIRRHVPEHRRLCDLTKKHA